MSAVRLRGFLGEIPKVDRRLLGDTNAQLVYNAKLTSGRLDTLYYPATVTATVRTGLKSIYRMYSGTVDYWLNWTSDVDVAKGPISGDTSFRIYFTSDAFEPRMTNLALATSAAPYPTAWYVLGVTPPTTACTVTAPGTGSGTESRAYVYTFVTQYGEESAPSPASAIVTATGTATGTWSISGMQTAPSNSYATTAVTWSGGYLTVTVASTFGLRAGEYLTLSALAPTVLNASYKVYDVPSSTTFRIAMSDPGTITDQIGVATRDAPHNTTGMTKRLYRSVTSGTDANYYFVKEFAVANTTASDDVGANIGEPIPTTGWAMPPVDLRGVRTLPSGALVGFRNGGNEVCFSEPLSPYAWPTSYRLTTDYTIQAVGIFGTAVAVLTSGTPYIAQGIDPASMSMTRIDQNWPCLSKRGVVEAGDGVLWPCPQGLAFIGMGGVSLATLPFYTQREWTNEYPATFSAAYHDNRYYAAAVTPSNTGSVLIFDRAGEATITHSDWLLAGMWADPQTGLLYVIHNNLIKKWDSDTSNRMPVTWKSKEFTVPVPINMGAARVEADFASSQAEAAAYVAAAAAQAALNAANIAANTTYGSGNAKSVNTYSLNGSNIVPASLVGDGTVRAVTFDLLVDNAVFFSKTVNLTGSFRLPAGLKYDKFALRVTTTVPVDSLLLGPTMDSLRTA